MPKDESPGGMAGKYIPVPIINGTPQGRSANFTYAQNNQTAPVTNSFFVYRISNYQIATITNELLLATKDNAGAFIDEASLVMDTAIRNVSNDVSNDIFSDGSGSRGSIGSISTGVITLADVNSVVNFEIGMTLVSYSVSGFTATQSTSAALGYIIAVDRGAGTVTVAASGQGGSAATPTNWSTSFPYLAVQGDVSFASNGLQQGNCLKICGLGAWLPKTAPTLSDSFWGVNRGTDVTRLGGVRYNGQNESIEECLIDGMALLNREGGMPDFCVMNFASYSALEKSLGSKVLYVDVRHEEADIGFQGIQISSGYGRVTVIADRNCPSQTAFLLQLDTWKLRSLGKVPQILTYGMEGLEALRTSGADALEIRWGYYGNLICSAPGWNAVLTLSQ